MIAYESHVEQVEHLALIKGDVGGAEPVLVRMHAVDTIGDLFVGDRVENSRGAMALISEGDRGVVVLLREARLTSVSEHIRELDNGRIVERALRDYGIGAQI